MKRSTICAIIPTMLISILTIACQSEDEGTDAAFEQYKENKDDSLFLAKTWVENNSAKKDTHNGEIIDPWTLFMSESNKKIAFYERSVEILKRRGNISDDIFKKIIEIESRNHQLKTALDEFRETDEEKRVKFQMKLNQDLEKIGEKIDEIKLENVR